MTLISLVPVATTMCLSSLTLFLLSLRLADKLELAVWLNGHARNVMKILDNAETKRTLVSSEFEELL